MQVYTLSRKKIDFNVYYISTFDVLLSCTNEVLAEVLLWAQ